MMFFGIYESSRSEFYGDDDGSFWSSYDTASNSIRYIEWREDLINTNCQLQFCKEFCHMQSMMLPLKCFWKSQNCLA